MMILIDSKSSEKPGSDQTRVGETWKVKKVTNIKVASDKDAETIRQSVLVMSFRMASLMLPQESLRRYIILYGRLRRIISPHRPGQYKFNIPMTVTKSRSKVSDVYSPNDAVWLNGYPQKQNLGGVYLSGSQIKVQSFMASVNSCAVLSCNGAVKVTEKDLWPLLRCRMRWRLRFMGGISKMGLRLPLWRVNEVWLGIARGSVNIRSCRVLIRMSLEGQSGHHRLIRLIERSYRMILFDYSKRIKNKKVY